MKSKKNLLLVGAVKVSHSLGSKLIFLPTKPTKNNKIPANTGKLRYAQVPIPVVSVKALSLCNGKTPLTLMRIFFRSFINYEQ
jgi:hypothetical protein